MRKAINVRGRQCRSLCSAAVPAVALGVALPALADPKFIETQELRIVYCDPEETYLVQHATQAFLSGLATHERLFDYIPDGHINAALRDFGDRGNAGARVEPYNRILFNIAASNDPYETVNSGDRFSSTAVHELTHIVTMDRAGPADARFRRLFHGKVELDAAHPETLLYYYLTAPRSTAPRWFHEGSAVFMETWLSGGRGRAQGGYDEMVFRAMVHDNAKFYDPLGLMSIKTHAYGARATLFQALPEHSTSAFRSRSIIPRSGYVAGRAFPRERTLTRSRIHTWAALATTMSTAAVTAAPSAIASS